MSLSAPRRTVSEYRGIVPIKDIIEKASGGGFVNFSLGGVLVENTVEAKGLILYFWSIRNDGFGKLLDRVVFWRVEYS